MIIIGRIRSQYKFLIGVVIGFFAASSLQNYTNYDKVTFKLQQNHNKELSKSDPSLTQFPQNSSKVAENLYEDIKILCMVLTQPKTQKSSTQAIKETWGKRCTRIVFLSTVLDEQIKEIFAVRAEENYDTLWDKVRKGFEYVYTQYYYDFDWFLKADDDTFVIMENLRLFLHQYQTTLPLYFGYKLRYPNNSPYFSGGAGYVLSKEALHRLVTRGFTNSSICKTENYGAEDWEIGKCMDNLGVLAADSRDGLNKGNFFPFPIQDHIIGASVDWFKTASAFKPITGLNCCSRTAVSFHYIEPDQMYFYEFLLYHARVFGVSKTSNYLPQKYTINEILQKNGYNATNSIP